MSKTQPLDFDLAAFAADDGTLQDLHALHAQVKLRKENDGWFDLSTPTPDYLRFAQREGDRDGDGYIGIPHGEPLFMHKRDQLPGRITTGRVKISDLWNSCQIFPESHASRETWLHAHKLLESLRKSGAPVLSPSYGEALLKNQHLIPEELLQNLPTLFFFGEILRDESKNKVVPCLIRSGAKKPLEWYHYMIPDGAAHNIGAMLLKNPVN